MRWAILDNQKKVQQIKNIREQSDKNAVKLFDGIDCNIGWEYDGLQFVAPKWTSYEFLLRLTAEERADIREKAKTDPNVADFLMLAQFAQEVISNDPVTLMGMNYLVFIGVFTEQRKKEILQIFE